MLIPFSVLFVVLFLSSCVDLIADINAHQVERSERRWLKGSGSILMDDFNQADKSLSAALNLNGSNPDYLQMLGRLGVWSQNVNCGEARLTDALPSNQEYSSTNCHQVKTKRMDRYHQAFFVSQRLRPYWPYSYADQVLYLVKDFKTSERAKQDFYSAWNKAVKFGSQEPKVGMTLLTAAFGLWDDLNWTYRMSALKLFRDALKRNRSMANQAFDLAIKSGKVTSLCLVIQADNEVPSFILNRCSKVIGSA